MSLHPSTSRRIGVLLVATLAIAFIALTWSSTSVVTHVHGAVMGIDFGSEYIKVASVKPGTPFHIVVDEQSKRKIPSIVAFDNGERHFGNGAVQLAMRKPKDTYLWAQRLLGKDINSPQVAELRRQGYPWEIIELPERRSLGFVHSRGKKGTNETDVIFSVEELVAMSLQHVMKIAESDAESLVKDCVITVPAHWTHRERQAMIDSAEIAGLNVLSLVNENTAAGIQYGIDRKYESPNDTHTVLFYNMGSTYTQATLVEYSGYAKKEKGKNKTIGQMEVRATGYDDTLGGNVFESRITEFVVGEVNKKFASLGKKDFDIRSNPKAMAKIRSACEKAKTVLSANQEAQIFLNSLYEDTDFKFMITREQFITMVQDLLDRVAAPIQQVLDESGVSLEAIDAVAIIGGGIRIPAVQAAIKTFVKKEHLTQSLNGDEAMVMGAVFRAANLSATFQVRQFGMVDETSYAVGVRITSNATSAASATSTTAASEELDVEDGDAATTETKAAASTTTASPATFSKRASLFKRHNRLQKKKSVQFTYTDDFECQLSHELTKSSVLPAGIPLPIAHFNITGLSKLGEVTKYAELMKEQKPRVSLSFLLDASGTTQLVSAEANLDDMVKVFKSKITTPKKEEKKKTEDAAAEGEEKKEGEADAEKKEEEAAAAKAEEEKKDAESAEKTEDANAEPEFTLKKKTLSIPLTVVLTGSPGSIDSMNYTQMLASKAVLERLRRADDLKKEIAAAKNTLEAHIYSTRSLLNEAEVEQVSTEDQREAVLTSLKAAEEWLYDQGDDSATIFKDKLASLKELSDPIFFRRAELTAFPTALNTTLELIKFVRKQVVDYTKNRPWVSETDRERLRNKADDLEEWLKEKLAAQQKLSPIDTPVLESEMMYERLRPIHKISTELSKLKKPADKPKVVKTQKDKKKGKKGEKDATASEEDATATKDAATDASAKDSDATTTEETKSTTSDAETPATEGAETKVEEEEPKKDEL